MDEELEEISADLEMRQADLVSMMQTRQIWLLASFVLLVWLIPSGPATFMIGVALFWFGTRWFKYYTLSKITEFEVWQSAVAREALEKLNKSPED